MFDAGDHIPRSATARTGCDIQYPLAHRPPGKNSVDQPRGALRHAPRAAARAKAPALAGEGNQVLGVAGRAAHPQETLFQAAALKVVVELPQHVIRQRPALPGQMFNEHRVMLFDELIEQRLFGLVALVTGSAPVLGGHPGRRGVDHVSRPCDFVFIFDALYVTDAAGTPQLRVDRSGAYSVPGGTIVAIDRFQGPDVADDGTVVFRATLDSGRAGIYASTSGGALTPFLEESANLRRQNRAQFGINNAGVLAAAVATPSPGVAIVTGPAGSTPTGLVRTPEDFLNLGREITVGGDLIEGVEISFNDNGSVSFSALGHDGLESVQFVNSFGNLSRVADNAGAFDAFRGTASNNSGNVAFRSLLDAGSGGGHGILLGADPVRERLLGTGDPLFGSIVESVFLTGESLNDGGSLTSSAALADDTLRVVRGTPDLVPALADPRAVLDRHRRRGEDAPASAPAAQSV
jgi:hypothetical protein